MPITQDDVRLYASQRMTDFDDGGGRMSGTVILDGVDNNVFDDITDLERVNGRTSVRKIFGAVVSDTTDVYLSAYALLDDAPDDAATEACIFTTGGVSTERAEAVATLQETWGDPVGAFERQTLSAGGSAVTVIVSPGSPGNEIQAGMTLVLKSIGEPPSFWGVITTVGPYVDAPPGEDNYRILTIDRPVTGSGAAYYGFGINVITPVRAYGVAAVSGTLAAAATTATVDAVDALVVPWSGTGTYPATAEGIDPLPLAEVDGRVPIFRDADLALVHSTVAMAPAAVSNGQTVSTTRTSLYRLRVVGNNGVEHARFTRGQPAPTGVGCTADLNAGTVTFSDVSGMSQPVTVEHRIEELIGITNVNAGTGVLTFNRGLARAFPAGTKISSLLTLGDLQGRVTGGFAQQAWTGVWSDARIGGEPTADFNAVFSPITTTNAGAISQRWAAIFTNTTSYRVIGETVGEVGTGNTGTDFEPINPSTGEPYFSVPAAGWGPGWSAGNVYRFDTVVAQAPLYALRCVAPSVPGGDDSVTVEFRGYVNA